MTRWLSARLDLRLLSSSEVCLNVRTPDLAAQHSPRVAPDESHLQAVGMLYCHPAIPQAAFYATLFSRYCNGPSLPYTVPHDGALRLYRD